MLKTRYGTINDLCKIAAATARKVAFVDTGMAAAGAGAPPDPAAAGGGGAPPMDPAMMDPAMAAAAGGAAPAAPPPTDPAMAGAPAAPPGGGDEIRQVIQQELAAAGIGQKAIKPKPIDERMARVEHMLANVVDFLKIPVSAQEMVDPLGMGPQDQQQAGGGGGGAPGGGDPAAGGGGGGGGGEAKVAAFPHDQPQLETLHFRATGNKAAALADLFIKLRK